MDVEVIKQLVAIFSKLTDGAMYALVAYIAYQFIQMLLIAGVAVYCIKKTFGIFTQNSKNNHTLISVAGIVGVADRCDFDYPSGHSRLMTAVADTVENLKECKREKAPKVSKTRFS